MKSPHKTMSWSRFAYFGARALEAGKFDKAEELFRMTVEKAESVGRWRWRLATSLNNLAEVYRRQGRPDEAEPLYLRAIEIDERLFEKNSKERSVSLGRSGIKLSYGDPASDLASDLNNLALLYDAQGRYSEAIALFQRAIRVAESALILRSYAETLRHVGQTKLADETDTRADRQTVAHRNATARCGFHNDTLCLGVTGGLSASATGPHG